MTLTNPQRKQLRNALMEAFNSDLKRLTLMVEDEVSEDLKFVQITKGESDPEIAIQNLIEWSESRQELITLLVGASRKNPGNTALRQFTQSHLDSIVLPIIDGNASSEIVPFLKRLTDILDSFWDFPLVETCCYYVWPDIKIHEPLILDDLANEALHRSVKWLVIFRLWLSVLPNQPDRQLSVVGFVDQLSQQERLPEAQRQALRDWLSDVKKHLKYDAVEKPQHTDISFTNQLRKIQGYLLIVVSISNTESEDSNELLVKGFLKIEVDRQNKTQQNERVPLQDLMRDEQTTDQDSVSNSGKRNRDTLTIDKIKEQLSDWTKRAEEYLSNKCRRLEEIYNLDSRPAHKKLVVEIFLPWEHLTEAIETWPIRSNRLRLARIESAGQKYKIAARSSDRISDGILLNQLNATWQRLEQLRGSNAETEAAGVGNAEPNNFASNIGKIHFDVLESRSDIQLVEHLKQFLSLVMTCQLCDAEHKTERERLIIGLLEAGIPVVLWSRNTKIKNLETDLMTIASVDCLCDQNKLLDEVRQKRVHATDAEPLGKHLALLCDEPTRLAELCDFYRDGALSA